MNDELVVDAVTGRVRQAGASADDTPWVAKLRQQAEADLYVFTKAILGRRYLTARFHHPICRFLQERPPMRKCLLIPRGHGKTTIVSHGLPLHILIQPKERNVYFPTLAGTDARIVLACETERRAQDHVRVIRTALEGNALLRALWPHAVWENPKGAKKWNDTEFIIPRTNEYPDPTVRGIGVGGAITGAHPSCVIKDDLIATEAANSPVVMDTAKQWHRASRALINEAHCLEWTIGTRWAVSDLYEDELLVDPTVASMVQGVLKDGEPVWRERFCVTDEEAQASGGTKTSIQQLQRESGVYFPLFYLNEPSDPSLTDFRPDDLRYYACDGVTLRFAPDPRDEQLRVRSRVPQAAVTPPELVGTPLTADAYDRLSARDTYLRIRARP